MPKRDYETGVYQLANGNWGYRFVLKINGKSKAQKRIKDENGNPFKTQRQAANARSIALLKEQNRAILINKKTIVRKTVSEVYNEYCEKGRSGKAYSTIRKQDSLWKNHLQAKFGDKYVDDISVAEIQDYLEELYYVDGRAFSYTESFLKMFYLIFGQAYSRNYIDVDYYNKLCINKDTKIHMPKLKIDDDLDIVYFNSEQLKILDEYFEGTNAETAYLIGRYCGLRINECFGLKWDNVDFKSGTITIDRQMQYQEGLIKLVPLKTRNARRTIYMCNKLKQYLEKMYINVTAWNKTYTELRNQNKRIIKDIDGRCISSLEMVNTLFDGKLQTVNSMKYHSRKIKEKGVFFKYHYLRHTYGTNLAALNTPEYLLCNQMGHTSCNVTHRYYVAISKVGIELLKNNIERL